MTKSLELKIYYLNWEEDSKLISQIINNEKKREYIQLESGESLYNDLCQMVAE